MGIHAGKKTTVAGDMKRRQFGAGWQGLLGACLLVCLVLGQESNGASPLFINEIMANNVSTCVSVSAARRLIPVSRADEAAPSSQYGVKSPLNLGIWSW